MPDTSRQIEAISDVVQTYVEGMVWGDAERMRRAFHPRACCIGHIEGGLEWASLEELIEIFCGDEAAPAAEPYWKINQIDVAGDTAVMQVENDWNGRRYDDTLTLLEHDGRWQIVSKVFFQRPDAP